MSVNSFGSKATLDVQGTEYEIFRLDAVPGHEKLPFSLKVLLENLLRTEDGANITRGDIEFLGNWDPTAEPDPLQERIDQIMEESRREQLPADAGDGNEANP